jgi:DNA damage-binding protein 1
MTDHPEPTLFILSPNISSYGQLSLVSKNPAISLYDHIARPAEFFTGIVVDPTRTLVVVSAYSGKLRILDLSASDPGDGFDVK